MKIPGPLFGRVKVTLYLKQRNAKGNKQDLSSARFQGFLFRLLCFLYSTRAVLGFGHADHFTLHQWNPLPTTKSKCSPHPRTPRRRRKRKKRFSHYHLIPFVLPIGI